HVAQPAPLLLGVQREECSHDRGQPGDADRPRPARRSRRLVEGKSRRGHEQAEHDGGGHPMASEPARGGVADREAGRAEEQAGAPTTGAPPRRPTPPRRSRPCPTRGARGEYTVYGSELMSGEARATGLAEAPSWVGWCCSYCSAPLEPHGHGLLCRAEDRWFATQDGVHRLLTEERRRELLPAVEMDQR